MERCEYCDEQCACHINPPCNFHTSHIRCEICDCIVCEDMAEEIMPTGETFLIKVCPKCAEGRD